MTTSTDRFQQLARLADFFENSFPGEYAEYELQAVKNHPALGLDPDLREIAEGMIARAFVGLPEQDRTASVAPIVKELREFVAAVQPVPSS